MPKAHEPWGSPMGFLFKIYTNKIGNGNLAVMLLKVLALLYKGETLPEY